MMFGQVEIGWIQVYPVNILVYGIVARGGDEEYPYLHLRRDRIVQRLRRRGATPGGDRGDDVDALLLQGLRVVQASDDSGVAAFKVAIKRLAGYQTDLPVDPHYTNLIVAYGRDHPRDTGPMTANLVAHGSLLLLLGTVLMPRLGHMLAARSWCLWSIPVSITTTATCGFLL